jgi:tetratricopeptide (TPR) repeat protein
MKRNSLALFTGFLFLLAACHGLADKNSSGPDSVFEGPLFRAISDSIRQRPGDADLLLRRALLLSQNNHQELAYSDFKKSWGIRPTDTCALAYASNLFLTGRNREALDLLRAAIRQFPANPEFLRRLGEAYVQAGMRKEALELYDEILRKDTANFEILYEKALLCTQLKDTPQAIALLEKAYRVQPIIQSGLALANLYAETRNPGTPALCDALLEKDSSREFIDPIYLKGVYYSNIKDFPRALSFFDECIKRDWKFVDPVIEKGIIFYEQKNFDGALKQFQLASYINYANPDVYYWMARCYEDVGKKDEALENYSRALALDKNFEEAKNGLDRLKK